MSNARLIILDRDGVLNQMVVNAEHGLVDSPLHPSQVVMVPGVLEALTRLRSAGYALAVATNQPAAAKGKTTRENLEAVHAQVLNNCAGLISRSFICWHRAEDNCACRKPKPHMLQQALVGYSPSESWMVGDGVTDVQAGQAAGVKTAFVGAHKCDVCQRMTPGPNLWVADLAAFALQVTASVP